MKRKVSLLLACLLICMAFVSCGKPAEKEPSAEPSPSPTPEVAVGSLTDEEIAAMKEKAKTIILTVEDGEFVADELAKAMLPLLTYVGGIETLIKEPKPDDALWVASVKTNLEGLKTTRDNIAALAPSAALGDLHKMVLATCDMFIMSAEKLALVPENQEENLKLSQDYLDIATKYLEEETDYMKILLENQPKVEVPIEITGVRLGYNSIGNPEVYVQFKNTGDKDIDAIDFYVESKDNYGEVVKPYSSYAYSAFTFQERVIAPGKSTSSDWCWTIYGADTTKSIRIGICKYHTTDGTTVEVPKNQYTWSEWIS